MRIPHVGYLLDSGNRSGTGLVGRSPWTAADAAACWQAGQGRGRPPHMAAQGYATWGNGGRDSLAG